MEVTFDTTRKIGSAMTPTGETEETHLVFKEPCIAVKNGEAVRVYFQDHVVFPLVIFDDNTPGKERNAIVNYTYMN